MISKEELMEHLSNYTAEEIAEAIRQGEVTFYELSKGSKGEFTPLLKYQVRQLLEQPSADAGAEQETGRYETRDYVDSESMCTSPSSVRTSEPQGEDTLGEESTVPSESTKMFSRPFSFEGRIRRTELWLTCAIIGVCNGIFRLLQYNLSEDSAVIISVLFVIVYLILTYLNIAQACKRCHDLGKSGWFQLIPFYGLVLLFVPGEKGPNRYGPSPKRLK